jgi:RimJ/RimL family protein N-acetyltransferase
MKLEMSPLKFAEVDSLQEIADLRTQYLDSLPEAQEYYLELLVQKGQAFRISTGSHPIGYFILRQDATLLEYFLLPEYQTQADTLLEQVIHKYDLKSALCKTYDHLLLSCCVQYQKQVSVGGFLFREYHPVSNPPIFPDVTRRLAVMQDFPKLCAINVEVFDEDNEIREYIEKQRIFLFEKDQKLVGFGIFSRIIADRPEHDIGMLVDKPFQRQGYGQYIIRFLTDFCIDNGWQPVCGCAYENTASRRTLEKAGFVSKHRLLNFSF